MSDDGPTGSAGCWPTPAGRELLFALTDEVLRTPDPRRSMAQLRDLVDGGLPNALPVTDRLALRLAAIGSASAPGPVAAIVRRRIRAETRGVIIPAADPAFARHVAAPHGRRVRRERQPPGRGDPR